MSWFRPHRPADDLRAAVECTWNVAVDGRHDLVPDGSIELLWIAGRGVWVCGPDRSGWSFTLPPGTAATGVRFRPGAGGALLGIPAPKVVDRRLRVGDVLTDAIERRLDEQLSGTGDGNARRSVLEGFVRQRLRDAAEADPMVVAAALLAATSRPAGMLDRVADDFGMSARHFRRRFTEAVGYGPAYYARIARLQRFLRLAATRPMRLAELAATAGYTDQAHLHHDCVELARMTPRKLLSDLGRTSVITQPSDQPV